MPPTDEEARAHFVSKRRAILKILDKESIAGALDILGSVSFDIIDQIKEHCGTEAARDANREFARNIIAFWEKHNVSPTKPNQLQSPEAEPNGPKGIRRLCRGP